MTKVEKHRLWYRLISYIPPEAERTEREQRKFERYTDYIKNSFPDEKDWADHTFMLLGRGKW